MAAQIGAFGARQLEDLLLPWLRRCKSTVELTKIHAHIIKSSLSQSCFLATKMIDICCCIVEVEYAASLFSQIKEPNVFLYNAMIKAYSNNQKYTAAISFFKQMLADEDHTSISPDSFTIPLVMRSCGGLGFQSLGKQIHVAVFKFALESNSATLQSILDVYAKCGNLKDAHKVFEEMSEREIVAWNCLISGYIRLGQMRRARALFNEMPDRTIVSWTAMISGCTQIGSYTDALDIFREMQKSGVMPDEITVISVLPACAQLGSLELGKWIHSYCDKNGLLKNNCVCNALIEMYSKCGNIGQARHLFDQMMKRDVVTWSTMIAGLANHGSAREAVQLFEQMKKSKVEPNGITFVGILSACAHAGFLTEGLQYFDSMKEDYKIEPRIEHYSCLVDLLGRSGKLNRALEVIKVMPMRPDAKIWGSLLSSCRTYRNLDVAVFAMEHLLEFEPDDTGNYVLLSNVYADLGKWDGVSKIRKLIRSKSMKKTPGCSSIEVDNVVREFISGDQMKAVSYGLCWVLELLQLHQSKSFDILEAMP